LAVSWKLSGLRVPSGSDAALSVATVTPAPLFSLNAVVPQAATVGWTGALSLTFWTAMVSVPVLERVFAPMLLS
jgi:hypothetical protein